MLPFSPSVKCFFRSRTDPVRSHKELGWWWSAGSVRIKINLPRARMACVLNEAMKEDASSSDRPVGERLHGGVTVRLNLTGWREGMEQTCRQRHNRSRRWGTKERTSLMNPWVSFHPPLWYVPLPPLHPSKNSICQQIGNGPYFIPDSSLPLFPTLISGLPHACRIATNFLQ